MKILASITFAALITSGCVSATHRISARPHTGEKSAFLLAVPSRIEAFHAHDNSCAIPKFLLWEYAEFLENLLRDVNQQIGGGETLSEEQLRSIATFAEVQAIPSYIYPTWRGTSGYDVASAEKTIRLYEQVLRALIPAMAQGLLAYDESEQDWDDGIVQAWLVKFDAAIKFDARMQRMLRHEDF